MKYLYLLSLIFIQPLFAQQVTIKGKVTDSDHNPIPYVTVSVKNKTNGTATDINGDYEITFQSTNNPIIVFSAIGYQTTSRAISTSSSKNLDIIMQADLEQLDEIVITSNRTRETLDQVPSSVSVISGKEIQKLARTSNAMADVLMEVPGLALSTNQTSSVGQTLRGRNMLVLIDGIPQSTPLRKGSRDINTADPSTIERIEVIKGATAIYGNGSDGGIVNYITKKPKEGIKIESNTTLSAEGGLVAINNTIGAKLVQTFSGTIDKLSYVASGSFRQTGVYKDANGTVISPFYGLGETSQYSALGKISYHITNRQSIAVMYNYFSSRQDSDYLAQVGVYGESPTIGVLGEEPGEDQGNRYNHNVQLTYDFEKIYPNTDFRLNLYFQDFKTIYGFTDSFYDPNLGFSGGQSLIASTKKGARFNFKTRYNFGAVQGDLLYGLDALNDKTSQSLVDGRPWVPQLDMRNFAPYAQLKAIYANIVLKGGIRFENIKIDIPDYTTLTRYSPGATEPNSGGIAIKGGGLNYNASTFNLGLRYNKWSIFKPFVSFSQSFSVADLGRILRSATENTVAQINSEAVIANNYEIGFNSRIGKTQLAGAYYISTSDLGSTYLETESGAFEILRQPEKVYGFELSLNTELLRNLDFGTSVSYTEGKIDTDGDDAYDQYIGSDRIPPVKTVTYLSYNLKEKFDIRLAHIYSGSRKQFEADGQGDYTYGQGPVDDFNIVNLTAHYQLSPSTALGVGVKNLLNTDYYNLISQWSARDSNYIKANGAQFNVSLSVSL